MRLARLAISVALAASLLGCSDDNGFVYPITSATPVVHPQNGGAMAIAHGAAIAVQSATIHEEIEGSSALEVTNMRSDDPAVLDIKRTSHVYSIELSPSPNGFSFVLVGVAPGTTRIRLYRDDDEVGIVPVEVVSQVP